MAEGLPSTQALLMFSLFSDWASQGYQGKVRFRRHICHIVRISFKLFLQIGVNDAMINAIRACETHLHNVISISKVRLLFRSKLVHLSNVYVVNLPNDRRSQMADGHLGWAQMADMASVSHLGSNFQPSLKWLTAYLKAVNIMVVHCMHVQSVSSSHIDHMHIACCTLAFSAHADLLSSLLCSCKNGIPG